MVGVRNYEVLDPPSLDSSCFLRRMLFQGECTENLLPKGDCVEPAEQSYSPPRVLALFLGFGIFVIYQWIWRPNLLEPSILLGDPVALPVAIGFALILGYALAMVWWLIRQTRGKVLDVLRPTRGRVVSAICLVLITPIGVVSWLPWIVIGMAPCLWGNIELEFVWMLGVLCLVVYPLAAMIQSQSYQRKWLRFALFSLYFWAAYAFHMLWRGILTFPFPAPTLPA